MTNKIQTICQARELSIQFPDRRVYVHTQPQGYNVRFDSPIESTEDFKDGLLKSRTIGFAINDVWADEWLS